MKRSLATLFLIISVAILYITSLQTAHGVLQLPQARVVGGKPQITDKTLTIPLGTEGNFDIEIYNPNNQDIDVAMGELTMTCISGPWDIPPPTPPNVNVRRMMGYVHIPAGGKVTVHYPQFNVGADAKPSTWSIDIPWKAYVGGNPIPGAASTDPYVKFTPASFGGMAVPVDKLALLTPYIGLASTIVVATVATAIYVKRVKRREEKQ